MFNVVSNVNFGSVCRKQKGKRDNIGHVEASCKHDRNMFMYYTLVSHNLFF